MTDAIAAAGYPAAVSNSAGTFVCNDVLYSLLHHYAGTDVRVGFIHVPFVPEQAEPSMPLEKIVAALEAGILAL
jgi:pyroglutamyl-peptidase